MFATNPNKKDYYAILGVSKSATLKEIKAAYKNKALKVHPDKNPHITDEQMKTLNEAWKTLSDPIKRAQYDRMGAATSTPYYPQPPTPSFHQPTPVASKDFFQPPPVATTTSPPKSQPKPSLPTWAETLNKLCHGIYDLQFYEDHYSMWPEAKVILNTASKDAFNRIETFKCHPYDTLLTASLTYLLAATNKSLDYLLRKPKLRNNIDAESLNAIVNQPCSDDTRRFYSALYFMTFTKKGLELLNLDDNLRDKITAEGLNCKLAKICLPDAVAINQ